MEKDCNRMSDILDGGFMSELPKVEIKPLTAEQIEALDTHGESLKETPEQRELRKDREDRRWNKQWAMDKSVEWCKHVNELVAPDNGVEVKIMTSSDVMTIADNFYEWLYKDSK